ncbi:hypothetical protein [Altererythrobacter sp. ZODW24]|uniref:thermonuclease family protein n=1 Tax=Altererythrobacter sp. ZODW24 TaxID=2185142 RepID=UPI000DF73DE2|nr:hypothetical protein [Altererythrobacter sp. ZODW24]
MILRLFRRILPFIWLAVILAGTWWMMSLNSSGGDWTETRATFPICGTRGAAGCVIDGDTIAIGKRKIRMSGYNAPELSGECKVESALALRARAELATWLSAAPFEMSGGDDPPYDQYGRELRSFKRIGANGKEEWLADHMIGKGLGRNDGFRDEWCK